MRLQLTIHLPIMLVAMCVAPGVTIAQSETTEWIMTTGVWNQSSNWSNGVPTESVAAVINNGGTAAVQNTDAAALRLHVGSQVDTSGTLAVRDGRSLTTGMTTRIGQTGVGTLYVIEGGDLISQSSAHVSTTASGQTSTALVQGHDSSWQVTGQFYVAFEGRGAVTVADGGQWEVSDFVQVGTQASAEGQVVVRGQGSYWSVGALAQVSPLTIGLWGTGEVVFEDGGTASLGEGSAVRLGVAASANATLRIGTGNAPGIIDVAMIEGLEGDARVVFDHDHDDHYFTRNGQASGLPVEISGSTQLEHIGAGTTVIEGEHAYTGATTIDGGTLVINGVSAGSEITVNAGGRLAGQGQVSDVLVDGGTLSPGDAIGTLTTGALTLGETAIIEYELTAPDMTGEGVNDLVVVDGDLVLDGIVHLINGQDIEPGTYTLMTYTGSLVDNGLDVDNLPPGFAAEVDTNNAGEVRIVVSQTAGTRYVSTDGSDTDNACLAIETPCETIAHAITVALDHDDILIGAGTYTESLTLDKPLSLLGEGRDQTMIQAHADPGEADDRVILIPEGTGSATLAAMTIRHGYTTGTGPIDGRGGGIHNREADLTLVDVTLRDSTGTVVGGGLYHNSGTLVMDGGVLVGNNSNLGAGINLAGSQFTHTIQNSVFRNNVADSRGGGLHIPNRTSVKLFNTAFVGNEAGDDGGGLLIGNQVDALVINSTLSGNVAGRRGAAIKNGLGTIADLLNVIIWNNEADGDSSSTSASIDNLEHSTTNISHSLIANSGGSGEDWDPEIGNDGGNNLDTDPLFVAAVDPADAPAVSGDLRLKPDSPAIDAGDNDAFDAGLPDRDLAGYARLAGLAVDLGAYETPSSQCPVAGVVHVNQEATEPLDGLTWASAFIDLQDALRVAEPCQIWVARGTYLPTVDPGDRSASFTIAHDGIALYGGFAGNESSLADRDWEVNETILSGDINATGDLSGNAYHVVVVDGQGGDKITNSTVIDGFFITAGNANGGVPRNLGGGMVCRGQGGGNECSPSISNVMFSGNQASSRGGGMFNDGRFGGNASPVLSHVNFDGNWAGARGGGMLNDGRSGNSSPILYQVRFTGNHVSMGGGGMMNDGREGLSSPTLKQVFFQDNVANWGGGMANDGVNGDGTSTLTDVVFIDNTAEWTVGGMWNGIMEFGTSNPVLINVAFIGNSAGQFGGGLYNYAQTGTSSPVLTNVLFSGNATNDAGGGLAHLAANIGDSEPVLTNVTFSGNSAANHGAAIFSSGSDIMVEIRNSVLWNNYPQSIRNLEGAHSTVSHSLAEGCKPGGIWMSDCGDEIDASNLPDEDPAFLDPVDPASAPTMDGNLRLRANSPGIAAGNSDFVEDVSKDLDGNPRVTGNAVDLGAFELADSVFGDRFEPP